ncbi:prepilin peptidase [Limosilactobacillus caviae]|uniref:prepilin peptidase n=1 Tax=Limosilactobacillus caviae TaxID=1769424 RepID=UPI00129B397A|nr:A24 family peptidase [Limosilactobacillus caviae]MCD7123447.1 prepilin peptidase [Limosilactobacillus caviae]MRH46117.1 prepilin peptidase [Limosilactobacillus reuteri]
MSIISFIFGASLASFIASYSYRLATNQPLMFPRSYCDNCRLPLCWWQLIPILSFVILHGQCFYCKQKINFYLPLIELLSGTAFAILIIYDPLHDAIIIIFLTCLIFLASTDFFAQIIYPYCLIGLFPVAFLSVPQDYLSNFASACILAISLLLFTALTKTLGNGDIEFLFIICLIWGWQQTLLIIQISSLIMLVCFVTTHKAKLPFVPALAFTTFLSIFIQGC